MIVFILLLLGKLLYIVWLITKASSFRPYSVTGVTGGAGTSTAGGGMDTVYSSCKFTLFVIESSIAFLSP